MYREKAKLILRRIFRFLAIVVFTCVCMNKIAEAEDKLKSEAYRPQIVDEEIANDGYGSFTLYVTFNMPVKSGILKVTLYDKNHKFIESQDVYFTTKFLDNSTLSATIYSAEAEYYNVYANDIEPLDEGTAIWAIVLVLGDLFLLLWFIDSLFYNAKRYYYNENEIIVYSGMFRHYIKLNGEKEDYKNTFGYIFLYLFVPYICFLIIALIPIRLSVSIDETTYDANISVFHRIKLKINNRLYNKRREFKNIRENNRNKKQTAAQYESDEEKR